MLTIVAMMLILQISNRDLKKVCLTKPVTNKEHVSWVNNMESWALFQTESYDKSLT